MTERESLDSKTWALERKIRAEVSLRNWIADGSCGLNFSNNNKLEQGIRLAFDNSGDCGDSFDTQGEIAEITKTSNFAKCSMNTLKQC